MELSIQQDIAGTVFKALDKDKIVGILHCVYPSYDSTLGIISTIHIDEKYRHKGIGSWLLELAILHEKIHRKSIKKFELDDCRDPKGDTFYQRHGFIPKKGTDNTLELYLYCC